MFVTAYPRRVTSAMLALALAGLAGVMVPSAPAEGATTAACGGAPPRLPPASTAVPSKAPIVTALTGQAVSIPLGYDKAENDADVRFIVRGSMPKLPIGVHTSARGLKKQGGKGHIQPDAIGLTQEVQGDTLTVNVCVDPAKHHINPGLYTGGLVIDDPRLTGATSATIAATVQYDHLWVVLWAGAGLVIGVSVLLVVATGSLSFHGFRDGLRASIPMVTTVGAAGVGAVTVWYSRAYQSPTYGADTLPDVAKLMGAMLTSGFTAGHIGNLVGSLGLPTGSKGAAAATAPTAEADHEPSITKEPATADR